ncbi:MAG: hypothetical protein J6W77_05345 [Prevotella sp.]|nr:hypothetical protein [Prevotella sp.]
MEERSFTERFKELAPEVYKQEQALMIKSQSFQGSSMLQLIWLCAKEIEAMRQEITELKQQLKK